MNSLKFLYAFILTSIILHFGNGDPITAFLTSFISVSANIKFREFVFSLISMTKDSFSKNTAYRIQTGDGFLTSEILYNNSKATLRKLDKLGVDLKVYSDKILNNIEETVLEEHLHNSETNIKTLKDEIAFQCKRIFDNKSKIPSYVLNECKDVSKVDSSLFNSLKTLNSMFDEYLSKKVRFLTKFPKSICDTFGNLQLVLIHDIQQIYSLQIHGSLAILRALNYRKLSNDSSLYDFEASSNNTINFLKESLLKIQRVSYNLLKDLPTDVWRCDQNNFIKSKHYMEVQRHPKRFIVQDTECNNEIRECNLLQRLNIYPNDIEYCFTESLMDVENFTVFQHMNTSAPFAYMRLVERDEFGNENHCKSKIIKSSASKRIREYLERSTSSKYTDIRKSLIREHADNFKTFSYMCSCINDDTYAKVCLGKTVADASSVITGARFIIEDGIIYLQIQQGNLFQNDTIDVSTVSWKPIEPCLYKEMILKPNTSVQLDDLTETNRTLVGLKLMSKENGSLALSIATKTPELIVFTEKDLKWSESDIPIENRTQISIPDTIPKEHPDIKTQLISNPNSYFRFLKSNFISDLAQRTLPFIDVQDITSNSPFSFAGAGLILKGDLRNAPFLALKLIGHRYEHDIEYHEAENNN